MRKLISLWVLSLTVVAIFASAMTAQVTRTEPRVLSGNDIGFRMDSVEVRTGKPIGTLVVRVNGQWLEVKEAASPSRVSQ